MPTSRGAQGRSLDVRERWRLPAALLLVGCVGDPALDGSVEEGMITFVSHSVLGFRDYITFKAVDEVGQSKLAVLSRPRLDLPDRGTNAARLDRWLLEAKQTLER